MLYTWVSTGGFLLGRSQQNGAILLTALIGSLTEIAVQIVYILDSQVQCDTILAEYTVFSVLG